MAKHKRNRLIYQSIGLQVVPASAENPEEALQQLYRVQSFQSTNSISFQDINEFGQLAAIDRINLEAPTVSASTEYYLSEGFNEEALNFVVNRGTKSEDGTWDKNDSFLGGHLEDTSTGLDIFSAIAEEGEDTNQFKFADVKPWSLAAGSTSNVAILGYGGMNITDFSMNFAVGEFPTASVSFEGSNTNAVLIEAGDDEVEVKTTMPDVDLATGEPNTTEIQLNTFQKYYDTESPEISALRPGDVTVKLLKHGTTDEQEATLIDFAQLKDTGSYIQSANISIPMSREGLQKLGTRFFYARSITFPLTVSVQIEAIMNGINSGTSLSEILEENPKVDVIISVKNPKDKTKVALEYKVKNCTISEQSFNSSIGQNTTASLTLETQIGSRTDTENGVFCYSEIEAKATNTAAATVDGDDDEDI